MKIRNAMLCAGLALGAIVAPGLAAARTYVEVDVAPPAPRYEVIPEARVGYVWAPGYYRWEGGRHIWTPGRWMAERVGYRWIPDRWERGPNGWYHVAGSWDRNGNGIPDKYERRAEGGSWGDRDHDGVPNRYDSQPYNPYRR